MRTCVRSFVLSLVLIGGLVVVLPASAAIVTSTAVGGGWTTPGTWVGGVAPATGDTVVIAGPVSVAALTQTALGSVIINPGGTLTATGTVTLGALTINAGGSFTSARIVNVLGPTTVSGSLNLSGARANMFTGDVMLNASGVWNNLATSVQTFKGNFTNNALTFTTATTSRYTFSGAAKTLSGLTVTTVPTMTFTGAYANTGTLTVGTLLTVTGATVRLTNNGTITATKALSGTGGITQGANAMLNIGGTSAITTLTATALSNTVSYTGAAAQTIKLGTYYHLNLSGLGTKTLAGATAVSGNFSNTSRTFSNGTRAFSVAGNFDQSGGFTAGTGVVTLNGVVSQSLAGTGALGFTNLTVANTAGLILQRNVSVTASIVGTVTLASTCPTNYILTSSAGAVVQESCPAAPTASAVDHVSISAPATGLALDGVTVTITPHDVANAPVTNAGTIRLSTSTGLGTWSKVPSSGLVSVANSGVASYTFGATESSVSLMFDYAKAGAVTLNVASTSGANLLLTTPVLEKANTVTFTMPGYVFTSGPCVTGVAFGAVGQTCSILNWPALTAGQLFSNIYITALNATGVPTRLHATQVRTVSMQFGLSCHDPVANAGRVSTFTATTAVFPLCQPNGAVPATWTTAGNISFPANIPSAGPFSFNYPDVGRVALWMQRAASTTRGSSGAFVVKPGSFVLSAIQQSAAPNLVNPAATSAVGAKFVKASEAFSVTVTATTCTPVSTTCTVANVATPNFGKEVSPESVEVSPANIVSGMVAPSSVMGVFGPFTAGVSSGNNFAWDEVGIITLTPHVKGLDYLGGGDVVGTMSGNVGRFYPDHFDTEALSAATAVCVEGASGLVYSDQPFTVKVTAKNGVGGTTLNYNTTTGFAKAVDLTEVGGGISKLAVKSVSTFLSGVATETSEKYTFTSARTSPTNVQIRATEAVGGDGVTSLPPAPLPASPYAAAVEGGIQVMSGRLKLSSAHGSELLPLPISLIVQYWNGISYVTNLTDSCSSLNASGIALDGYTLNLSAGDTALSPLGTLSFVNGIVVDGLKLSKPGAGNNGSVALTVTPAAGVPWLPSNSARATFGVYKGSEVFIDLRESY